MPTAAAADSRLTCQVIFLTRRWPRSLDWRAAATPAAVSVALASGAAGLCLVTTPESPVNFWSLDEEILK